jgi:hypothetical protein
VPANGAAAAAKAVVLMKSRRVWNLSFMLKISCNYTKTTTRKMSAAPVIRTGMILGGRLGPAFEYLTADGHGLHDGAGEKRWRAAAVQDLAEMRSGPANAKRLGVRRPAERDAAFGRDGASLAEGYGVAGSSKAVSQPPQSKTTSVFSVVGRGFTTKRLRRLLFCQMVTWVIFCHLSAFF